MTDVVNNKIKLINKIGGTIDHVMRETNNETNMINEIIHKVSEMDNDTLHLIDNKLDKIITQTRKKLKSHLKIRLKIKIRLYLKLKLRLYLKLKLKTNIMIILYLKLI